MVFWIILFLLIMGISFVLAYRSMNDYQEIPNNSKVAYGLFLIRQTDSFDARILDSIGKLMLEDSLIISLERLFKGKKAALTIYGPKNILDKFTADLNLLELEDYSLDCDSKDVSVWELGIKDSKEPVPGSPNDIFQNLSGLGEGDQFFWQVILGAKSGKGLSFQTQIRAVVYTKDPSRRKLLVSNLENLKAGGLVKAPKPFSPEQMLVFYHLRSLSKDSSGPVLDSEGVMSLLKV